MPINSLPRFTDADDAATADGGVGPAAAGAGGYSRAHGRGRRCPCAHLQCNCFCQWHGWRCRGWRRRCRRSQRCSSRSGRQRRSTAGWQQPRSSRAPGTCGGGGPVRHNASRHRCGRSRAGALGTPTAVERQQQQQASFAAARPACCCYAPRASGPAAPGGDDTDGCRHSWQHGRYGCPWQCGRRGRRCCGRPGRFGVVCGRTP